MGYGRGQNSAVELAPLRVVPTELRWERNGRVVSRSPCRFRESAPLILIKAKVLIRYLLNGIGFMWRGSRVAKGSGL